MNKGKRKNGKPQKSIQNKLKALHREKAKRDNQAWGSHHQKAQALLDEHIKTWSKAMEKNTPPRTPEDYIIPERKPKEEPSKIPCVKKKNLNKLLDLTVG